MDKLISIVSGSFNEADNIEVLYLRIKKTISKLRDKYKFEIIFIDNDSKDGTQDILRTIAKKDREVKVILNTRNFGHIRSPYWGITQSTGAATIYLASDLQDPPEKIKDFIEEWEKGWLIVLATKKESETGYLSHRIRKAYYRLLNKIADVNIINDSTGFGLYDARVIAQLKKIKDPYPFLRGIIAELGYSAKTIDFIQPKRAKGLSKNNLYTLYDIGILGIICNSLIPIRVATFFGIMIGITSILVAIAYLIAKLIYWNTFSLGIVPIIVGMFFLMGMTLVFLGIIGEYIANIQGFVKNRALVIEKERINFDSKI